MGAPTKGTVAQPLSDTALFTHIAFKLEDKKLHEYPDWAGWLGVGVGRPAVRNAPATAARLDGAADRRAAVCAWVDVDWRQLDFFVALVRLAIPAGAGGTDLLEAVPGVVSVCRLAGGEEVVATVVYERRSDREALRRRLADLGDPIAWDEVEESRTDALTSTVRSLAREAASRERLQTD